MHAACGDPTSRRSGPRAARDEGLFTTIKNGIAGTEMPPQPRLFDHETWQILAYLRTLAPSSRREPPRGNAENGQKIYQANCAGCHRVEWHRRPPRT